jgi:hypothetical protein
MYCIYKLTGENGLVYYGSTKNYSIRMNQHKHDWKSKRSDDKTMSKIFKGNFKSEILEEGIPLRHIALIREGYYIYNFPCINYHNPDKFYQKIIQNGKKGFKKNYMKKWREENKEKEYEYRINKYYYQKSWGGDKRIYNNLLEISLDIFK